jgi:hypothetical protein
MTQDEHNAFVRGYRIGLQHAAREVADVIDTSRGMFHDLQSQIEELHEMLNQARVEMWRLQMISRAQDEQRPNILQ